MQRTTERVQPLVNRDRQQLPSGVRLFVRLLLLLTAIPAAFLLELAWIGDGPLKAKLWSPPDDRFGDFWHYRVLLQSIHRPEFFAAQDRFAYPAPCAILYQWLYHLGSHPHVSYTLMLWAAEALSAGLLLRALLRRRVQAVTAVSFVLLLVVFSYPWHVLYDRANIELFVYMFIAAGVWAWLEGHEDLAAVLWGCAGAFKLYPLFLLALYAKRGSWRRFALGLATCVAILLLSFWYVGPTIKLAASGTMWGVRGFVGTYGAHTRLWELVFDHSLLGGMKEVLAIPFFHFGAQQATLSHLYEAAVALLAPVGFVIWRRSAPAKNQLCLLLLAIMAFPPVSYDYTLIYAYMVMGIVICDSLQHGEPYPGWKTYFVSFALLFTAENWVKLSVFEPNGALKAASLVALAVTLVRHPFGGDGRASEHRIVSQTAGRMQRA